MDTALNISPTISVVMPVHNGEKYLNEAIESILFQTFSDFEFLIINDGSVDKTEEIILSYTDSRIKYIKHDSNIGLIDSLNEGIRMSTGEFIARMDSDDVSTVDRFEKQINFLNENREIDIVGSWFKLVGEGYEYDGLVIKHPTSNEEIRVTLLAFCPIAHPSIMMRRKVVVNHTFGYKKDALYVEDYDLWSRLIFDIKFANINSVLLHYRIHQDQVSSIKSAMQQENGMRVKLNFLYNSLSLRPGKGERELYQAILNLDSNGQVLKLSSLVRVIWRIKNANLSIGFFHQRLLSKCLVSQLNIFLIRNHRGRLIRILVRLLFFDFGFFLTRLRDYKKI